MPPKLGILAGGGELPRQLIGACLRERREHFVVAFEGNTDAETVAQAPHRWVRIGAIGTIIAALKEAGVEDVVMTGKFRRPSWRSVRPDRRGLRMLPKVMAAGQGDGDMLRIAIEELEGEGFRVVGIDDVLRELIASAGPIGRLRPDRVARQDIERALAVGRALGAVDVGQAVVVQQGLVLGVEAVEGTDALLERCAGLRRPGPGGVLLKLKKSHQDRRADLPTIGTTTVANVADAGLAGIAIEAGETLIVDRAATIAEADSRGIFLFGFEADV